MDPEALADILAKAIKLAVDPLHAQLRAHETRLAEVEARPVVKEYRFTWRPEERYVKGETVTHGAACGTPRETLKGFDQGNRQPGSSA